MTVAGGLQLAFFLALIAVSTPLLGGYLYLVYRGGPALGDRLFMIVERRIYTGHANPAQAIPTTETDKADVDDRRDVRHRDESSSPPKPP